MSGDPWVMSELGSGSFGTVKLFTNKHTDEKIALKEMKHDALQNLPPLERKKMEERMLQEIKIMRDHEHSNLVKARNQPEDIIYKSPEFVLHVWMEYCEGGDLRNGVLRNNVNCCGIPECEVRRICRDVNNGLKFLHSHQIIHRDLKPENILLKEGHGRMIYKLTDFGYAKLYTQCSKAHSIVGTVHYVAPEVIIESHEHGRTVDFWSFGIVVFEIVSLQRPFLHDERNLFKQNHVIQQKSDHCIHIYWGDHPTDPIESSSLPSPHQLCSPFQEELTLWLRMALQTSPDKRGGHRDESGNATCLVTMDRVLSTKVINIVCMASGKVASFRLRDTSKLSDLTQWIQENMNVDPVDQYLVSATGTVHTPDSSCDHLLPSLCTMEENCGTLYLFVSSQEPSFKLVRDVCPAVKELIQKQDNQLLPNDVPRVYAQTFFHLREQHRLFERLHSGHRAILHEINSLCQQLRVTVEDGVLERECHLTAAVMEYMQRVHTSDLQQLEQLQENKPEHLPASSVQQLLGPWRASVEEFQVMLKNLEDVKKDVKKELDQAKSIIKITEEMQSVYSSNRKRFADFHEMYVEKAQVIYAKSQCYTPFQPTSSNAQSSEESMFDLYVSATQAAEKIIMDCLNGKDYIGLYFQLKHTSNELKFQSAEVAKLMDECNKKCECMRRDLWNLVQHKSTRRSWSQQSGLSTESNVDIRSVRSSSISSNAMLYDARRIQRGMSISSVASSKSQVILSRLKSQTSISESFNGDSDPPGDLMNSLKSLSEQVQIIVNENSREISENNEMLQRMNSAIPEDSEGSVAQKPQAQQGNGQENSSHLPTIDPENATFFVGSSTLNSEGSTMTEGET